MRVDATSYDDAVDTIIGWALRSERRYVCIASVNNVMEAHDNPLVARAMNEADLVTPDGMPLVWSLRALGVSDATRVYGPDLTPRLCEAAAARGVSVGFLGGTEEVLRDFQERLLHDYADLRIGYAWNPPFRALESHEEERVIRDIKASGVRILLVGLGCPKQELWMWQNRDRVDAVMVGVGAAFDFISGHKRQAPRWLMRFGLEWVYRLVTEPRRLWRRYLRHNPRFVALFVRQYLIQRLGKTKDPSREERGAA